ncbi:hypothetical protein C2845_PM18G01490 [Panicum miliaceum]|uniref:DNA/RNA-binding protein Alba-like domain-containing protein n=1 Tax=Panicum miliaceum TaxID=4540 RepID=A0A3L6PJ09_PANMI|nr:hypothetical protein C2845_PM18G01490 [Panicum miliaceum]
MLAHCMDRYHRVEKPRNDTPISQNEIRITTQGRMRNYISYGMSLLEENGHDEISIKAMGRAINKTVMVVELIKRRVGGLHQNTVTESVDITDTWEPLEEGLLPLETTRHVSMITVTLSKKPLDTSSPGYQPPIPAEEVKPAFDYDHEGALSVDLPYYDYDNPTPLVVEEVVVVGEEAGEEVSQGVAGEEGGRPPGAGVVAVGRRVAAEEATTSREAQHAKVGVL